MLERLTHHVHILEMKGDGYRLKQSKWQSPTIPGELRPAEPT